MEKEIEDPMVIVMEPTATEEQIQKVIESLVEVGYDVHRSTGVSHTVLGAVGSPRIVVDPTSLELIPGVREVVKISAPYKLVGRTFKSADTIVDIAGVKVGGPEVIVMAGPCSVESKEQVTRVAKAVAASGARVLRGGAFKPRTSPYAFQGHGEEALRWMGAAAGADGLLIEVHDDPEKALSDGAQSLYPEQFARLMSELRVIAPVLGRSLPLAPVPAAGGR